VSAQGSIMELYLPTVNSGRKQLSWQAGCRVTLCSPSHIALSCILVSLLLQLLTWRILLL